MILYQPYLTTYISALPCIAFSIMLSLSESFSVVILFQPFLITHSFSFFNLIFFCFVSEAHFNFIHADKETASCIAESVAEHKSMVLVCTCMHESAQIVASNSPRPPFPVYISLLYLRHMNKVCPHRGDG